MSETRKSGTHKFSIVFTATRSGLESFKTLDEMPPVLRATCVRALQSRESATLVIADEAGRGALQHAEEPEAREEAPVADAPSRLPVRLAAEILLLGSVGLALWVWAIAR